MCRSHRGHGQLQKKQSFTSDDGQLNSELHAVATGPYPEGEFGGLNPSRNRFQAACKQYLLLFRENYLLPKIHTPPQKKSGYGPE